MKNLILASASPRRKELMELLGVGFEVKTKDTDEVIDPTKSACENVEALAYQKAYAVGEDYPEELVIGCDTVVVLEDNILGKPKTKEEAFNMLKSLQGKTHKVYTGVTILSVGQDICKKFHECSEVTMKKISDVEIEEYIATGEPMDKAGAYGIQGHGAVFISKIVGDYFNIVGLPVQKIYDKLKEIS